jgi:biopolymer transport protein ExbB
MFALFSQGGPVMWPILVLSVVTFGVVIERLLFLFNESRSRDHAAVQRIFQLVEHGRIDEAAKTAAGSPDMIARVLAGGLEHRETSLNDALLEGASAELERYNRGLVVLDTAVTLGPLLGLLGTVTGMMKAFNIVGGSDLAGKQAILTGGISECLIAVTFGLTVAIIAIIPLNYLNACLEKARRKLEAAMTRLELLAAKHRGVEAV